MKKDTDKKKNKPVQVTVGETAIKATFHNEDAILETFLKQVGGKWKIRIIWALRDGESQRYGSLKKEIARITDMMLSQSLKELVAHGIVERHQYQEIPPRVEYQITAKGKALLPVFESGIAWVSSYTEKKKK